MNNMEEASFWPTIWCSVLKMQNQCRTNAAKYLAKISKALPRPVQQLM